MPSEYIYTEIDGNRVKLSNLDKLIYPDEGIIKSEMIQYYLSISEHLLVFARKRPLTLVRYPDGVNGEHFFARNMPKWTPDWMGRFHLPWDQSNVYLILENTAHLIWLANLAALEIHSMNCTVSQPEKPDHFIVDLDPDPGISFEDLKGLAREIKSFLEEFAYTVFVKTSGGKGLHLGIPILTGPDHDLLMKSLKELFLMFIEEHPQTTLQVHKDKRKGKVLIDIYRNHRGNTTVIPFSLRGKPGAPISMPIRWEHLDNIESAQQFNLRNYKSYLEKHGNAWKDFQLAATRLHNVKAKKNPFSQSSILKEYEDKRNFKKTPEPFAEVDERVNDKFVVQLHAARNLHYDLRLGIDGVLKSWAIPKGLPVEPGVKRLAIATEDHPPKYIDFEGHIPKGQYGAGDMWVYRTGTVRWFQKEARKLNFQLKTDDWGGIYKMYKTKDEHWLVEREDDPKEDLTNIKFKHMLAGSRKKVPQIGSYQYEIKWDGIRAMFYISGDEVRIVSRNGRDLSSQFPELTKSDFCEVEWAILDAEIVCLDEKGRSIFSEVISRMHSMGERKISQLSKSKPAVAYYFDLLLLDGMNITTLPLSRRQEWMNAILKTGDSHRISEVFEDGNNLWHAAKELELEGIMAKKPASKYRSGERTEDWLKVKYRNSLEVYILGYTEGKGDRAALFGALHVAEKAGQEWIYRGKVGTGFDEKKMNAILSVLLSTEASKKLIKETIEEESRTKWIKPIHRCQLNYASLTGNGRRDLRLWTGWRYTS